MLIYGSYLTVAVISMGAALFATPAVRWIGITCGKVDAPAIRKVHRQPMVRLGGVAIFLSTVLAVVWFLYGSSFQNIEWLETVSPTVAGNTETLKLLLFGGSAFFLIGLSDDLLDLSAIHRLWLQGVTAALLWQCGLSLESSVTLPFVDSVQLSWLSLPVTVLWIVGVVNAINWMDGLDGLAAGISSVSTFCLMMLSISGASDASLVSAGIVSAALLGGLLGFLFYNAYPAKIFMGDGGSYFVGFILASLCIVESQQLDSGNAALLSISILLLPLLDIVLVIAARLYRKKSPFEADNRHLHHRLLSLGFSHRATVWLLYGLTLVTGFVSLALMEAVSARACVLVVLLLLLFVGSAIVCQIWKIAASESINTITGSRVWYSKTLRSEELN